MLLARRAAGSYICVPRPAKSSAAGHAERNRRAARRYINGDPTASDFGGYQEVLAVHAEGGFEAEKLQAYREYDFKSAVAYARKLAGI